MDRSRTRLRILLVEDSAPDAALLTDMLADELPGSTVTVARTLAHARTLLGAECDVVITDLALPDADGVQSVVAVRAERPDVPLLVLTGHGDREQGLTAMSAGADDYLVKGLHDPRGVSTAVLYAVERRRFERDTRRFARLAASLLDAMESPTCSVDASGTVVAVNRAWLDVATLNGGGDPQRRDVGCSYLDVCEVEGDEAAAVAAGLRRVLAGEIDRFELDYPCRFPDRERWFSLRINPLAGGSGAVLTHVDVTVTKEAQHELLHQSLHDTLTGLPNRTLLEDRLAQALAATRRDDSLVGVAFVDLDHFKRVNDSQGHPAGDELLRGVADRLTASVRAGDTVARFAGDEFVVVWPGLSGAEEADVLAARLSAAFDEPFPLGDGSLVVTASAGVALGAAPESPDRLLLEADAAMYDVKRHGRRRTRRYTADLRSGVETRLRTETDLRAALDAGDFVLHYQPVVDLRSGDVRGVEALVRWEHRDGLRMPDTFIPLAESTGLVVPLGAWVIEEACRQAAAWSAGGLDLDVAVNLSVRQVSDPEIAATIEAALLRHGVDPTRLLLEVTESAVMDDADAAEAALDRIAALGAAIAIDDFGTGYSSLLYLKRFPVRALKVDRSFVSGMGTDGDDDAIVASVVGLAHAVGSVCIAEGVETEAQQERLTALGCELAQGYLFSPAVAAEALPAALERVARVLRRRPPVPQGRVAPVHPDVLRRIAELRREGASPHTIAAALNREQAPHPQGVRWHRLSVEQVADGTLRTVPRRRTASSAPARPQPACSRHSMAVWTTDDESTGAVTECLGRALARGESAVLVADAALRRIVEGELHAQGLDVAALRAAGRYLDWDSDDLLARITIDGHLSGRLFRDLVASTVESLARRGPVLAVGDLSGRLAARGQVERAAALEELFERLVQRVGGLSVVCAYPAAVAADTAALERVRRCHGSQEQVA